MKYLIVLMLIGAVPSIGVAATEGDRAIHVSPAYWVEEVIQGLDFPSSMVWLPNGDMLIPERMGSVRIVRAGRLDPTPINGAPASYVSIYDGLRDIALDPDFERNHTLYLLVADSNMRRNIIGFLKQHSNAVH